MTGSNTTAGRWSGHEKWPGLAVAFDYGFRPFFLLAGLYAALVMPLWLLSLAGTEWSAAVATGIGWHAHELYYGFVGAAVAGFLLTAVASWTARPPVRGWPLALLVAAWLAGRVGWNAAAWLPPWLLTALDLAFPVLLVGLVAREVLAARNHRNLVVVAAATVFFAGSLLIDLEALGVGGDLAQHGRQLAGDAIVLVIVIIGGRIVPAFTRNALARRGDGPLPASVPVVDGLSIAGMAAFVVARQLPIPDVAIAAVAAVAAAANLVRLALWRSWRTLDTPILWVLHVAYLWISVGLALIAAALVDASVPINAGVHALGAGAAATMILAVMTRAALGHTGRPLAAPPAIAVAYGLLTLAALVRVVALFLPPAAYQPALDVAGSAWTLAFVLFVLVYAPILLRPRLDEATG